MDLPRRSLFALPKKEAMIKKEAESVPKNSAAQIDDVVSNTVELFHAWTLKRSLQK